MRREAMVLGHPLFTFPIGARLRVQSIGSGVKYLCLAETIRGWDLSVDLKEQKPGYNHLSILEIWIEDEASGRSIYGFAKYLQAIGSSRMLLRIVEIDGQSREWLQELIEKRDPIELHDAV